MYVVIHTTGTRLDAHTYVSVSDSYEEAKRDMYEDVEATLGEGNHDEDGFRTDCFYRYDGTVHESIEYAGDPIHEWHLYGTF